jgi:formylglycine-generating enzyme required for sulfatase activity
MTFAVPPKLARIPAGEFLMGATGAEEDERPIHRVYVAEFLIGCCPVTQDEYARFVSATGHPAPGVRGLPAITAGGGAAMFTELAAPYTWTGDGPPPGHGSHPVVLVRYEDAVAYCGWLSKELSRTARLPTEAEWEKAARGGVEGQRYPWGDDFDPSRCNFLVDASAKSRSGTSCAGMYSPNAYGLYDMAGNVWEWVSDWHEADYYAVSELRDPGGPRRGTMRIVRGGSWLNDDVGMLRCAYRHRVPADTYAYSIGFRIVCTDSANELIE